MENATLPGSVTRAIGKRIKSLRKAHSLTQEDMADKFGVSRQTIQKWESGESLPAYPHLFAISDTFCVSYDFVLCRSERLVELQLTRTHNAPAFAGAL